ncbi:UNVERIFIED_CONTAM: Kinesin-like protein KIN-1 [Sesamum radiatum]|uniref:Kinesin-like protein n=1 Tax=Sesamum radiatum TaxID=300843 RepID=A0AAW2V7H1_SESRA
MPNIRVSALFRPLSLKEKSEHGDSVSIRAIDTESFIFKVENSFVAFVQDEKEEEIKFHFDRVFFQGSQQADIYEFLALPIVKGVVNGVNGAIITYGQTGAGKTYSMEGPGITECNEEQKGLLPRVVDGLFNAIKLSDDMTRYTIKLSMVEIYLERVRDLFDLSKDNLQIKESKVHGIFVSGVTELIIAQSGIANRAVGETHKWRVNYAFGNHDRYGKLILVDLAGSEKAERTGAEGRVLEEAKTINKSLSALGNLIMWINLLSSSQGGNSQTALLCCCSPSPSNASESLSSLRFGARAKHIKALPHVSLKEDEDTSDLGALSLMKNESCERILEKLSQKMKAEDVQLLEQLFILEGIFFDPNSVEEVESAYDDVTSRTISTLQKAVEELSKTVDELKKENQVLKSLIRSC